MHTIYSQTPQFAKPVGAILTTQKIQKKTNGKPRLGYHRAQVKKKEIENVDREIKVAIKAVLSRQGTTRVPGTTPKHGPRLI